MLNVAQSRWWSTWATGGTAVSSHSMATLLVLPGWLPTPHLLTLPSLPAQDASMVLGKAIQGGAAAAEVPEYLHKVGCFSSSWWERPWLGKQSPLEAPSRLASSQKVFVWNRLVLQWRASCRYTLKTMWKDKQESHARYPHVKYSRNANEWGRKRKFIKASQDGF